MTDAVESSVRALLADRASAFEDPEVYMAGVDDALRARCLPSGPARSRTDDASPGRALLDGRGVE